MIRQADTTPELGDVLQTDLNFFNTGTVAEKGEIIVLDAADSTYVLAGKAAGVLPSPPFFIESKTCRVLSPSVGMQRWVEMNPKGGFLTFVMS